MRLQNAGTNGRIGYCLDPADLFVAKACAAREKDRVFNAALLKAGIVSPELALARCAQLPDADEAARALAWTRRLCAEFPAA